MGSGMPHRFSVAVDRGATDMSATDIPDIPDVDISDADRRRVAGGRINGITCPDAA
jgi:hypothetical protein